MKSIKILSNVISFLLVLVSYFFISVSGVGIVLAYMSLPFFVFSKGVVNRNNLRIFVTLFLIAHFVLVWRVWDDSRSTREGGNQILHNPALFKKCSENMFGSMDQDKKTLSLEQEAQFSKCMNREI